MSSSTPAAAVARQRKPLVGVSFKMYFDIARTHAYLTDTLSLLTTTLPTLATPTDIFVIPDFVTLASTKALIDAASPPPSAAATSSSRPLLQLGAQDVHSQDFGAFTGEVSPVVLSQVGVRYVEIGHAERRRLFGETDDDVAKKAEVVARNGMVPLVCIGERSRPSQLVDEEDGNATSTPLPTSALDAVLDEVWTQIAPVLSSIPPHSEVVFAYEPVWAIGASHPAPASYVVAVTKAIRQRYNATTATSGRIDETLRILYGGSAGPGLFEKLREGVDGLFLGRFAHRPEAFVETVREVAGVRE